MRDRSERPQVSRVRREKRRRDADRSFDGGSVAVGLLLALTMFVPSYVFTLPAWLPLGSVGIGLFLGGFLASSMAARVGACRFCHGVMVGVLFVGIVAAVTLSTHVAPGEPESVALVATFDDRTATMLLGAFGSIAVAGLGGLVAALPDAATS